MSALVPLVPRDADGRAHVLALSGGGDSTCLAVSLADREPRNYFFCCTPTGDELPDMLEHMLRLGELLGSRVYPIMGDIGLIEGIKAEGVIPNRRMRWCTRKLKIVPFIAFLRGVAASGPVTVYVGLRADEPLRVGGLYGHIEGVDIRHPLREWGMTEAQVDGFNEQRGIIIPERTDCARCYHQQIGEWWRLWHDHYQLFAEARDLELEMGQTFREPKFHPDGSPVTVTRRGLTYAASSRDTWPVWLADMETVFAAGHVPTVGYDPRQRDIMRVGGCRTCTL